MQAAIGALQQGLCSRQQTFWALSGVAVRSQLLGRGQLLPMHLYEKHGSWQHVCPHSSSLLHLFPEARKLLTKGAWHATWEQNRGWQHVARHQAP
mmetsp:Transcript_45265/g.113869  ORF Transcript_45265/g.113869 Transcript_45265/m.113869 type:complete len:95 (+) Transcript_45265:334-618(+)